MDKKEPTTSQVCSCCGAIVDTDDYYAFDGSILCENCYFSETTTCEHCGDRIWLDDNAGTDNMPLCQHCYDNYYTTCEGCGRIIHRDYANYDDDDYAYCDRCYEERQSSSIHEYSYKPEPIFYGDSKRYFGVELEIDDGGKDSDNADSLLYIGNRLAEHIYIKSDGSLEDGMEIVTHPMSLSYHKNKMPWEDLMKSAVHMYYRSHKTSTCGLHIHVNRTAFGSTREAQDECISRVLYFVEQHWLELLKFSRRTEYQMNRWAARYGYKNNPKEILEDAKKGCNGRYTCVNITNYHTIEFRMFRGTLKYNTLIASLELVDCICELALSNSDTEISKISWTDFVSSLDEEHYSELITYLKERRLYINSPIEEEEDD
ncbi:MAG: amidoligase family protein [Oscillospiraceae bacterium]